MYQIENLNMNTFRKYYDACLLNEAKNSQSDSASHLAHIEDLVIEDGKRGYINFIQQVTSLINYVTGLESDTVINLKVDGAPALFFGLDPREEFAGMFFVANKYTYKTGNLAHSIEELNDIYAGKQGLIDKLAAAFTALKPVVEELNSKKIYQGDILFTSDSKKSEKIDGMDYITYRPQLLTYAVPVDSSELHSRVSNAQFGIAIHDSFSPKLGSDKANPASLGTGGSAKQVDDLEQAGIRHNVFIAQSFYPKETTGLKLPEGAKGELNYHCSKAEYHVEQIEDDFDNEYTNQSIDTERTQVARPDFFAIVKQFLNNEVRTAGEGKANVYAASYRDGKFDDKMFNKKFFGFLKRIYDKSAGKAKTLKTTKGREKAMVNAKAKMSQYESTLNNPNFQHLIMSTHHMIQAKRIITDMFDEFESQMGSGKIGKSFVTDPATGDYVATPGEGFVLFVKDNVVKQVQRISKDPNDVGGFSQLNLSGQGQFQKPN